VNSEHLIIEFKDLISEYLGHYSPNTSKYRVRNAICITIYTTEPPPDVVAITRDQAIGALQSLFDGAIPLLPNKDIRTDETDQILTVLGQEHPALILDCTESWPDNALGAAAGCITASGILFILMPGGLDISIDATPYEIHLKRELRKFMAPDPRTPSLWSVRPFSSNSPPCDQITTIENERALGFEQQHRIVTALHNRCLAHERTLDLLLARRGRGKSATLGQLITRLHPHGHAAGACQITLTSPHKKQVTTVLKHADNTDLAHTPLQVALHATGDVLIVDEAGSVPLPVLNTLITNYSHCIFAGTVDGYEGSGRALAIRLADKLANQENPSHSIQSHTLHQPLRWPSDDPVETLVQQSLRLGIPVPSTDDPILDPINFSEVQHQIISSEHLLSDTNLLDEVFGLLLQAHYQTSAKDLKHLLNQHQLTLWIQRYKGTFTGACLIAHEGGLSPELQAGILSGDRRPAHQKLPMLLYRQCHLAQVLQAHHWRIVRIAIQPSYQRKGLGLCFLKALHKRAKATALNNETVCSYLGASFGATDNSYRFWHKAGFEAIHLGFKINPRSAQRALTVMMPLHNQGAVKRAHANFIDTIKMLHTLCHLNPDWLSVLYHEDVAKDSLISTLLRTSEMQPETSSSVQGSDDAHRLSLWQHNQLGLHDIWGPLVRSLGGLEQLAKLDTTDATNVKQLTKLFKAHL